MCLSSRYFRFAPWKTLEHLGQGSLRADTPASPSSSPCAPSCNTNNTSLSLAQSPCVLCSVPAKPSASLTPRGTIRNYLCRQQLWSPSAPLRNGRSPELNNVNAISTSNISSKHHTEDKVERPAVAVVVTVQLHSSCKPNNGRVQRRPARRAEDSAGRHAHSDARFRLGRCHGHFRVVFEAQVQSEGRIVLPHGPASLRLRVRLLAPSVLQRRVIVLSGRDLRGVSVQHERGAEFLVVRRPSAQVV